MLVKLKHSLISFCLLAIAGLQNSEASDSATIRVGSEVDFPPYSFIDKDGKPSGFSVELIQTVARVMDLPISISTGTWNEMWNNLTSGDIDLLPIVAKSQDRKFVVDFSVQHTETFDAFFVSRGTQPIRNLEEAKGRRIVVMKSDAAHHELLARKFQGTLVLTNTIPEGLELVATGKESAFLCSKLIGSLVVQHKGIKGLVGGPPIPDYKRTFSFAVKKGNSDLLEKLNQGLIIVKTNGEYDRIYNKWISIEAPWRRYEKYLVPALIALASIFTIVMLWIFALQQLVKRSLQEIHARKMLEEELRAALDARDEFLSIASHELRSPLTALRMQLNLLLRVAGKEGELDRTRILALTNKCDVSSVELEKLIDDLLDVTRIRAGRLHLNKSETDLENLVADVVANFSTYAAEKGSTIEVSTDNQVRGQWDPTRISQIITNLVSNAIKYGNGKPIQLKLSSSADNKTACLIVRDHGIGIAPHLQCKIFERFERAFKGKEISGLGLGLYITRQIVQAHGGTVRVESVPQEGSTFTILLPIKQ